MQTYYPIIRPLALLGVSHKQYDVLNSRAPVHLEEGDTVSIVELTVMDHRNLSSVPVLVWVVHLSE